MLQNLTEDFEVLSYTGLTSVKVICASYFLNELKLPQGHSRSLPSLQNCSLQVCLSHEI